MADIVCYDLIDEYFDEYTFVKTETYKDFYAIQQWGRIGVPEELLYSSENQYVFALLHEIGHCKTYNPKQHRVQREFLATQWAIERSKKYGINLCNRHKKMWQDYIDSFTKTKDKNKYKLNWEPMNHS